MADTRHSRQTQDFSGGAGVNSIYPLGRLDPPPSIPFTSVPPELISLKEFLDRFSGEFVTVYELKFPNYGNPVRVKKGSGFLYREYGCDNDVGLRIGKNTKVYGCLEIGDILTVGLSEEDEEKEYKLTSP